LILIGGLRVKGLTPSCILQSLLEREAFARAAAAAAREDAAAVVQAAADALAAMEAEVQEARAEAAAARTEADRAISGADRAMSGADRAVSGAGGAVSGAGRAILGAEAALSGADGFVIGGEAGAISGAVAAARAEAVAGQSGGAARVAAVENDGNVQVAAAGALTPGARSFELARATLAVEEEGEETRCGAEGPPASSPPRSLPLFSPPPSPPEEAPQTPPRPMEESSCGALPDTRPFSPTIQGSSSYECCSPVALALPLAAPRPMEGGSNCIAWRDAPVALRTPPLHSSPIHSSPNHSSPIHRRRVHSSTIHSSSMHPHPPHLGGKTGAPRDAERGPLGQLANGVGARRDARCSPAVQRRAPQSPTWQAARWVEAQASVAHWLDGSSPSGRELDLRERREAGDGLSQLRGQRDGCERRAPIEGVAVVALGRVPQIDASDTESGSAETLGSPACVSLGRRIGSSGPGFACACVGWPIADAGVAAGLSVSASGGAEEVGASTTDRVGVGNMQEARLRRRCDSPWFAGSLQWPRVAEEEAGLESRDVAHASLGMAQGAVLAGEVGASSAADENGKGEVNRRREHHSNSSPVL